MLLRPSTGPFSLSPSAVRHPKYPYTSSPKKATRFEMGPSVFCYFVVVAGLRAKLFRLWGDGTAGGTYMYDLYEEVGLAGSVFPLHFTGAESGGKGREGWGGGEGELFCFAGIYIGNCWKTVSRVPQKHQLQNGQNGYRNRKTIMCVPTKIDLALVFCRSRTTSSRTHKFCGFYTCIHIIPI